MELKPKTPDIFAPLWTSSARYLAAWGGRGSGKSWDRALHLAVRMATERLRACCVREVQLSLRDSVHQLLVDTIQREGLGQHFNITENQITCLLTGSTCIFKGMKDQNAETIKSLEGMDIVWWEEAQTASRKSLDLLRPTVRKPGSQIWFTWNPRLKTDPVDVFLRQQHLEPHVATVLKVNWNHNPWFPAELELERQIDLQGPPARYRHIWEGDYLEEGERQFIPSSLITPNVMLEVHVGPADPLIMAVDVARFGDDRSVIWLRQGRDAESRGHHVYRKIDTMRLASRVAELAMDNNPDAIFIDGGGVGGGVVDRCRQLGLDVIEINFGSRATQSGYANMRAQMWGRMREALKVGVRLPDDQALIADLMSVEYDYTVSDNKLVLEKKEDMKKRGLPSPDRGDALALTYALPVYPNRPGYEGADYRTAHDYDPYE